MATTRRPQINHKACDHAATPKARKACRKATRKADQAVSDFTAETTEALLAMRANLTAHPSVAARMLVIDIDAELATRAAENHSTTCLDRGSFEQRKTWVALDTTIRYSQTFNGKHVRYVKVIEDRGDKALVRYATDHRNNTSYEIDKSVLVAR